MNKLYMIFFLLFSQCYFLEAGNRHILFFVNWHDERIDLDLAQPLDVGAVGFGPITINMLTNIWQKAAPMVVSSVTWRNYLERKQIFLDFVNFPINELVIKYQGKSTRFHNLDAIKLFAHICKSLAGLEAADPIIHQLLTLYSGFLICHFVDFNEKEWIVSKISEHGYLFIPKTYQEKVDSNPEMPVRNASVAPNISDADLRMGLKYINKPLPNIKQIAIHDTSHVVNFSKEFVDGLKDIFVTQHDIVNPAVDTATNEENKRKYMHIFDAYGIGHGGHGGIIMALSTQHFRSFLEFLNDQIRMRFLFYNSCYSGGVHLQAPYEGGEFNFTITTGTFLYAPTQLTYSWYPNVEFHIKFTEYFRYLQDYFADKKGVGLEDVLKPIYQIGKVGEGWQLPVVRLPGWQKFKVIDLKKMDKIGVHDIQEYERKKKNIEINNKDVIILDVEPLEMLPDLNLSHLEVPVPVIIQDRAPSFFSMSTDAALCSFHSITSNRGFVELVKSFIPMAKQTFERTYYIARMTCRNDLKYDQATIIGVKEPQLIVKNVIIVNNAQNPLESNKPQLVNGILFSYKNIFYSATWPNNNEGLWQTFDKGSLPGLQRSAKVLFTYLDLFAPYIISYPSEQQEQVREIIGHAIGQKIEIPKPEISKNLLQTLQRLKYALNNIQRLLSKS